jgi:hypothetical protein
MSEIIIVLTSKYTKIVPGELSKQASICTKNTAVHKILYIFEIPWWSVCFRSFDHTQIINFIMPQTRGKKNCLQTDQSVRP